MKRITLSLVGLLALLLAPSSAWAQAGLLSNTTLNGAITATQTTLVLTSASASAGSTFGAPAANQCLLIDLELMRIRSMSSTTATVTRGTAHRSTHATLAIILTGPCEQFKVVDPPNIGGNQDCDLYVVPWVNVNTGASWWCEQVSGGAGFVVNTWTVTYPYTIGTAIASRRVAQ